MKSVKELEKELKEAKAWEANVEKRKELNRKANERFKKLSDAQKRVAVAKDVLRDLETQRIVASHGTYMDIVDKNGDEIPDDIEIPEKGQFNDFLEQQFAEGGQCQVCAIGSVFTSKVIHYNDYKARGYLPSRSEMVDHLSFFPSDMLDRMEDAFEADKYGMFRSNGDEDAHAFGNRHKRGEARLVAIMKNIIDNKGEFVP